MQHYPANYIFDDDNRVVVSFPDFPEALTDGSDIVEAFKEAKDALEEAVAGRINRGEDIPQPSKASGDEIFSIPLSPGFSLKAMLYSAWKDRGISKVEFADILGINEKEVRRLLDPHYW